MSQDIFKWGGENFCSFDAVTLYSSEPERLQTLGYPTLLTEVPESFCSTCLLWWIGPDHEHTTGSEHRPPQKGNTDAQTSPQEETHDTTEHAQPNTDPDGGAGRDGGHQPL